MTMWLNHKLKNKDHPCIEAQEKSVIVLIKDVSENEIKVREQIASLSVPQAGTEQKVSLGESWKSDPLVRLGDRSSLTWEDKSGNFPNILILQNLCAHGFIHILTCGIYNISTNNPFWAEKH